MQGGTQGGILKEDTSRSGKELEMCQKVEGNEKLFFVVFVNFVFCLIILNRMIKA